MITAKSFFRSSNGNVAMMAALLAPVLALMIGLLFETGLGLSYIAQSKRVIALACERSTKPTRTMTPSDADRRKNVLDTFDTLAKSSNQQVISRDATINWLDTNISASFKYVTSFANIIGFKTYEYKLNYQCTGIPPFPHDGEVLLSSSLQMANGTTLILDYYRQAAAPNGCWNVFKPTDFGWEGGDGPGIEVQDWSYEWCRNFYQWTGLPPADFPTRYAIELDSWANSSMYKQIELHPGKYEISVWYNGRNPAFAGSNQIDISLQKLRPVPDVYKTIISMKQDAKNIKWEFYKYNITVDTYSVYNIKIAAAEKSDSAGGIITSFTVKYIDR